MDDQQIEQDLELYELGRQLRSVINSPGWEVIMLTIQQYVAETTEALLALPPGDPEVPTAHAAASALKDFLHKFRQDIKRAVDFANEPSEDLREYLTGVRRANDVQAQMGQGV